MAKELTYKNTIKVLTQLGEDTVKDFQKELSNHRSTGELYKSIKYKVKGLFLHIELADYGEYVDAGREPGSMPPVSAIKKWADSKGINAWAVATNIKKYGIEPVPFLFHYKDNFKAAQKPLLKAYAKDIGKSIDETLKILKLNK